MRKRKLRLWGTLVVIYLVFVGWYTSFGGPLTQQEIERYLSHFEAQQPPPSPEQMALLRTFMEEDSGDDFLMVNLIDMREKPRAIEGVEPGASSDDVLDEYMAYMTPALLARASHPVFYGRAASAALDLMHADGMDEWTVAAGMRYRSRRDMLDIATNPGFRDAHPYKVAAMSKTIAFPIDPWFHLGDPRLVLALVFGWIGCAASRHRHP